MTINIYDMYIITWIQNSL